MRGMIQHNPVGTSRGGRFDHRALFTIGVATAALILAACSSSETAQSAVVPDAAAFSDGAGGATDGETTWDRELPDVADAAQECVPKTCAELEANCGSIGDGCGGSLTCGTCKDPYKCGAGGTAHQCGCTPSTCLKLGISCGDYDTGCGTVSCGSCTQPDTCVDHQCTCACTLPHATTSCSGSDCAIATCESGWENCDGLAPNGCETNVGAELANCGGCGTACAMANAVAVCSAGTCQIVTCADGFQDCDGNAENGCEVNLRSDTSNCGSCFHVCPASGGAPACTGGLCSVSTCVPGFGDCNPMVSGCETNINTSASNCGACGNACSFPNAAVACAAGSCTIASCNKFFGNCDANLSNGCETNLAASVNHCGGCGNACPVAANASRLCLAFTCSFVCNANYANCDDASDNGCEVNYAEDPNNCGGCTATCSSANLAVRTCKGGNCGGLCTHGFDNCNGDLRTDGCETNILTNPNNCGGCAVSCSDAHIVKRTCSGFGCTGACVPGWADCNFDKLSDGCEKEIAADPKNCGGCGIVCSSSNVLPACSGGLCSGSCSAGFVDCNGDKRTDGCEINIKNDNLNCGSCGHTCPDCTNCSNGSCLGTPCK